MLFFRFIWIGGDRRFGAGEKDFVAGSMRFALGATTPAKTLAREDFGKKSRRVLFFGESPATL
jgi:hypothetical protein